MEGVRDRVDAAATFLREADPRLRRGDFLAFILGSGLSAAADALDRRVDVPFADIPHQARVGVPGHRGVLRVGECEGRVVVAAIGRVHLYEGWSAHDVVHIARTLARLRPSRVVLTNAAGGIRPDLRVGDLMLIRDHVNATGTNPLYGVNDPDLGPRFPDMSAAWDDAGRRALQAAADRVGIELKEGVYWGLCGPSYETPAEVRAIAQHGGDAVGMSTVLEAIALRHMGVPIAGLSVISNAASGLGAALDHGDVERVARHASERVGGLMHELAWSAP
jgi:inosine/guanosine/xanthosine phosphorylase family protein